MNEQRQQFSYYSFFTDTTATTTTTNACKSVHFSRVVRICITHGLMIFITFHCIHSISSFCSFFIRMFDTTIRIHFQYAPLESFLVFSMALSISAFVKCVCVQLEWINAKTYTAYSVHTPYAQHRTNTPNEKCCMCYVVSSSIRYFFSLCIHFSNIM